MLKLFLTLDLGYFSPSSSHIFSTWTHHPVSRRQILSWTQLFLLPASSPSHCHCHLHIHNRTKINNNNSRAELFLHENFQLCLLLLGPSKWVLVPPGSTTSFARYTGFWTYPKSLDAWSSSNHSSKVKYSESSKLVFSAESLSGESCGIRFILDIHVYMNLKNLAYTHTIIVMKWDIYYIYYREHLSLQLEGGFMPSPWSFLWCCRKLLCWFWVARHHIYL